MELSCRTLSDGRIEVMLNGPTVAQCNDEWANSEEGKTFLSHMITYVDPPKVHEIKKVMAIRWMKDVRLFVLTIERDPCPVLFFGGATCPLCGGDHAS